MSPRDRWVFGALGLASGATLVLALGLLLWVVVLGAPAMSWAFFTQPPHGGLLGGGVLPAIAGTVLVTVIAAVAATPVGVAAGVFLTEYAPQTRWTLATRVALRTLAGVPSVLYGLFGVVLFVDTLGFGLSALSAGLTLGLLTLPWTISVTEQALRGVPKATRRAAFAVGATRWDALRHCVLPAAMPSLTTGLVLTLTRAAGETAPLLFTGASFATSEPWGGIMDPFMALPYHLYVLATQHPDPATAHPVAFATALVLVMMTGGLGGAAAALRGRSAFAATRPA
ncbi:MAG: phosphate ABC transporter permease PstA [Alphaproteobacteria bacterium]|nr:phosphate ABC transporter permease PstA [Alphaproteobacteria bacterium]